MAACCSIMIMDQGQYNVSIQQLWDLILILFLSSSFSLASFRIKFRHWCIDMNYNLHNGCSGAKTRFQMLTQTAGYQQCRCIKVFVQSTPLYCLVQDFRTLKYSSADPKFCTNCRKIPPISPNSAWITTGRANKGHWYHKNRAYYYRNRFKDYTWNASINTESHIVYFQQVSPLQKNWLHSTNKSLKKWSQGHIKL